MAQQTIHTELEALCTSLDVLADTVFKGYSNDQTMQQTWGWNFPAANRHDLSRVPRELADAIRQRGSVDLDESAVKLVKEVRGHVDQLTPTTTQYLWNGNGNAAASAFLATLSCARASVEPLIGWQSISDVGLYPAKMARRLRTFQAQLDEIAPDKEALKRQISLINEATSAAESLPTDLEALTAARKKVAQLQEESLLSQGKIAEKLAESDSAAQEVRALREEASKLVAQCEEAYRITTTKGLAAAWEQRAKSLGTSMWVWVVGLVLALGAGYFLGTNRLELVVKALNSSDPRTGIVWINGLLALVSFGAPVWLGWIATKQIGQRFRLAEDYGFKASVAKAYEGYRKEAVHLDPAFASQLFASALTRLDEHPLRLVEEATPGSPWHEFVQSDAFNNAFNNIPGFRDQYDKIPKKFTGTRPRPGESASARNGDKESVAE